LADFKCAFELFEKLAHRYFDAATHEYFWTLADSARDTTACREWCQTVFEVGGFCNGTEPVPNASFTCHFDIDRPDAGRIAELLLWQLCGALSKPGTRMLAPPLQIPTQISLGGLGVLNLTPTSPHMRSTEIDWSSSVPIIRMEHGASQPEQCWEPHLHLSGSGLNAVVPLSDRALSAARLQDFPIVRSPTFTPHWGRSLILAAEDISEYSTLASAAVARLVTHVLPLVCGDERIGSASRQEAFGLVFLPAAIDCPDQMAECLLHEAMHQYLFRLESCARLFDITSPSEELFYSPWRQDKRPLRMTLHGSFVFSAVADLYLWAADVSRWPIGREAAQRRAYQRYREATIALSVVRRYGVMTELGSRVLGAIDAALAATESRISDWSISKDDIDAAIDAHRESHATYLR
jgi:HEXXH motif-containing protein